ncbi:MAG: hypothetical protein CL872_02760 [Dehalococcoidaceae bacterium]|jgi:hypothetical protein|nr:hypothetical protein [Dehalococcoidaceae bacterium]|tara:strand:+ start:94 stop:384 length:291 start_codon:yes stop_codon:yes gene_type:complete
MYGSIFTLKVKSGHEEELLNLFKSYDQDRPKGGVAWFVLNADSKEEWVGVAVFASKEEYVANAERPEQHENFVQMMEHLESEPEWTDGEFLIGETY